MANRTTVVVVTALLCAIAAAAVAVGAGATISGPCTASINGESVKGQSSTSGSSPIVVAKDATVPVTMTAATPISSLEVTISLLGLSRTVKSGPAHGTSWVRTVKVGDYSFWGVGLYQVTGSSTGSGLSCSGVAIVKVEGSPLSTVAGWLALGLTGLGALGLAGAALKALHGAGMVSTTLLGLIAGLVTGLGATVLLQQFSVLFPTGPITIGMLALGAVAGVGLSLLMHLLGTHGHAAATPVAHA